MLHNQNKGGKKMKRYQKGRYWRSAIFFTILAALSIPYNTGTYSLFFWLIEVKKIQYLIPFVLLYIIGYVAFFTIDKERAKSINRYQAHVQTDIKLSCVEDAIACGKDTSEVISFLDNDMKILMDQYFGNIFQVVSKISIVIFTLLLTLSSNWIFALVYLVLGFIPLKLTGYLAKKIGEKTTQYSDSVKQTTTLVKDVVRNKKTLMNYNVIENAIKKTKDRIFHSESSLAERNNQMAVTNSFMNTVYTIANIIPIAIGIYMGMKGYLTISAFVAVQYSSGWIVGSLGSIAGLLSGIKSTVPIYEKVVNFKKLEVAKEDEFEDVKVIEFINVDFGYNLNQKILENFSFTAKEGNKVLIQGASGSGKSTILKLISGELNPQKGKVLLNGKELLHRKIGFVSQNPAIFCDTIRYNLTLGKDFQEEMIMEAINKAGLHDFVEDKGLNYELEEDANNISGGQKQRIEISRALLFNCSTLLVDEGTSALDKNTADKIHDTLMKLEKIVIEVAHYIPEEVKAQFDQVLEL